MTTISKQSREESCGQASGSLASYATEARSIVDIRRDREDHDLRSDIYLAVQPQDGSPKYLPTLLLYDERGLKLFEEITYLEEYYPTNAEIEVLETHADAIAENIKPGSVLLELGSGNLRKVDILLRAIDRLGKQVEYYALDLSLKELQRTLAEIPAGAYRNVKCFGLHGTYDDGLEWLKTPKVYSKPKCVLSLGSSIGNFPPPDAAQFIRGFAEVIQPNDQLLIGIDGCTDPERVYHAYNDRDGVTHEFIANGLHNANRICGKQLFDVDDWQVIGAYDESRTRHEAFVSPKHDTTVDGVPVRAGERLKIEESNKYTESAVQKLFGAAGIQTSGRWSNGRRDYALHMASKSSFAFDLSPEAYASDPVPSWDEWCHLWTIWDAVTRQMISDKDLFEKPIKLRNACIFYLGHIPGFFDIKLTDVLEDGPIEPASFQTMFERGIDPDVDNPEKCHAHSEIPDAWPELKEILEYQGRVRDRVKSLYDSGKADRDRNVSRALWLGYEHECMHLETLLYMLIQSENTLPPPNISVPDFKVMACEANAAAVPNQWITVPENEIVLGLDDAETPLGPKRYFGWDMEKPSRTARVHAFSAKARPITIGEYAQYLQETGKTDIPASWMENEAMNGNQDSTNGHSNGTNGLANGTALKGMIANKSIRSVYGPIPISLALHWPVAASYDELAGCAAWMGGRIPSYQEAQSIYSYVDGIKRSFLENSTQKTIPAVNSQMVNEGVEETPPQNGSVSSAANGHALNGNGLGDARENGAGKLDPRKEFVDLTSRNVGFQQWCPTPVAQNGNRLSGLSDMGGVWEWTSTSMKPHEGYEPMLMYPAYSQDFFDDKHNIVLGGSWATAPRLAGRMAFVNWYQRNYPYVWAGARVVRDL